MSIKDLAWSQKFTASARCSKEAITANIKLHKPNSQCDMRFLVTFAILATVLNGLHAYYDDIEEDVSEFRRGRPAVSSAGRLKNICKRDILFVYDLSKSVGKANFEKTQNFVKHMIDSPELSFGVGGSHLALEIFSETTIGYGSRPTYAGGKKTLRDITKIVFGFGKYKTKAQLKQQIDNLNWERDGRGEFTETEVALKVANDKGFPDQSPRNHRPAVADVLILFTDGLPNRKGWVKGDTREAKKAEEARLTLEEMNRMKEKGVRVITIATGDEQSLTKEMKDLLTKMASSEEDAFSAQFSELDTILEKMIGASCRPINPAHCKCTSTGSRTQYVAGAQSKIEMNWLEPTVLCRGKPEVSKYGEVIPNISPPAMFGPGDHSIQYNFYLGPTRTLMTCNVDMKIVACECPKVEPIVRQLVADSYTLTNVKVPKLACQASFQGRFDGPKSFGIGKHTLRYTYSLPGGRVLQCGTPVTIEGRLCAGKVYTDNEVCCCGKIQSKKRGHECCGNVLYNVARQQCCRDANIRGKGENCP